MKKEYINLYKKLLFTPSSTTPALKRYAIVESARDWSITEEVISSGLAYVDLWHEEMFELEQERPLYLVELKEESRLLDRLLAGHKKSIATYLISPYDLEIVQSYYSPFTYVHIEQTRGVYEKAIFGFYDPNILPNYIKTLRNEEKIDEFFAGACMWLCPGVEHEEELYIAFRAKNGNIEDVNIPLTPLIKEENPMLNFDDVSLPVEPNLEAYAHEVTIDYAQIGLFDALQKERFVKESLQMYREHGYSDITATQTMIEEGLKLLYQAIEAGVADDTTLRRYILLGLLLDKPLHTYDFYEEMAEAVSEEERADIMAQILWQLERERRADGQQ